MAELRLEDRALGLALMPTPFVGLKAIVALGPLNRMILRTEVLRSFLLGPGPTACLLIQAAFTLVVKGSKDSRSLTGKPIS